jgi:hypothetical protein
MSLATEEPTAATTPRAACEEAQIAEPQLGVIEEASRRQRRRRARAGLASILAAGLAGAAALASGISGSHPANRPAPLANDAGVTQGRDARAGKFNVRLWPGLSVGVGKWCWVVEEGRSVGASGCSIALPSSDPILVGFGQGPVGSRLMKQVALTEPQVAAVLVNGRRRVPTVALPGLPYGIRAAVWLAPPAGGERILALDRRGVRIPFRARMTIPPRQAVVRSWRYPSLPPRGYCRLQSAGLPARSARGGTVATAVQPFSGQLAGHAFLPCIATRYYLRGTPLKALVVLDAANPTGDVAALPDFRPVRGVSGFYSEGASITARRSGRVWLVAEQGSGLSERIYLLRHLRAVAGGG